MPIYVYGCDHCDAMFEQILKISEMELPLSKPCPECNTENSIRQEVTSASFGDPIKLGIKRPDAGWNEVLGKVKAAHPKGNWNNQKISPISGR